MYQGYLFLLAPPPRQHILIPRPKLNHKAVSTLSRAPYTACSVRPDTPAEPSQRPTAALPIDMVRVRDRAEVRVIVKDGVKDSVENK